MFDLPRTLALVKGALFEPEGTWSAYLPEADDWKKTAALLTGPLILASVVLHYVVDLFTPSRMPFHAGTTFGQMLLNLVIAAIAAVVIAAVVAFLAGMFKGRNSFAHALAATSFAFVPGYLGRVAAPLPWIGWLLSLGLGIYGLILLWRILPLYMDVPEPSRTGHYILSLVVSIATFFVIGVIVGAGRVGPAATDFALPGSSATNEDRSAPGMFGELERSGRIMEAAEADVYDPPADGKITGAQMERFVAVMEKANTYREAQAQKLEELAEKAEDQESGSLTDLFSGMSGIMSITTAEMEIVKTGDGNWAEHQWIKEQLRTAMIQRDTDEAVRHNYELYQRYEERLQQANYF